MHLPVRYSFFHGCRITILAEFAARRCSSDDESKNLARWAITTEENKRLNAMVSLAKSELPVAVEALDAKPWLLNCQNGTVDLRTGTLREHRREDFITKCAPVEWSEQQPTGVL